MVRSQGAGAGRWAGAAAGTDERCTFRTAAQPRHLRRPLRRVRAVLVHALRRLRRALHTRLIPLLSLVAAFAFVVMMCNIPLPGGTSGHAVGVAAATIVLGPWASILAISVALVIQALFFGDGGVTAIGANCFNMAVVGSFVAYAVYVAAAGRAPLASSRRVAAAALAGYVAVNAAALATAIEFGLQPLLYHDATGAPLYCPYPLGIAVPAMMIGT